MLLLPPEATHRQNILEYYFANTPILFVKQKFCAILDAKWNKKKINYKQLGTIFLIILDWDAEMFPNFIFQKITT